MTVRYVGIGGNNANSGLSWALRKLTLNGVEDSPVAAGDTVYVGAGTYRELLTVDVSGTAGNPITYIGDYTGANTDGVGGVVRVTGSADDLVGTRINCISASAKNYRTFRGFLFDGYTGVGITLPGSCTNITIDQCYIDLGSADSSINVQSDGDSQAAFQVTNCVVVRSRYGDGAGCGLYIVDGTGAGTGLVSSGHVVSSTVFIGGADGAHAVTVRGVGGITVRNCYVLGGLRGVRAFTMPGGRVVTVNNCLFEGLTYAVAADVLGAVVENYNRFWACAVNRTNTATGANSLTGPPLHDRRWFFEAVNGGTMATPYDLASYSTSVELNSGTGAPTTDMRGASVVGSFREWGPLEYSADLDIEAGAGGGGAVSISPLAGSVGG